MSRNYCSNYRGSVSVQVSVVSVFSKWGAGERRDEGQIERGGIRTLWLDNGRCRIWSKSS